MKYSLNIYIYYILYINSNCFQFFLDIMSTLCKFSNVIKINMVSYPPENIKLLEIQYGQILRCYDYTLAMKHIKKNYDIHHWNFMFGMHNIIHNVPLILFLFHKFF